jgi:hypothetical protein
MAKYRAANIGAGASIFFGLIWIAAIGGWIANIVKIFYSAAEPITALFVLRCVGIFVAPLGSILGFL